MPYTRDPALVRGLDYYTGIVYETTVNGWEKFGSVASGGRYDNLASLFTDRKLPGVGASIGLDRLLALMEEAGWLKGSSTTVPVLVANFPGVDPVGDVDLVVLQQRTHCVAKQRGVVARQRGAHQHDRFGLEFGDGIDPMRRGPEITELH